MGGIGDFFTDIFTGGASSKGKAQQALADKDYQNQLNLLKEQQGFGAGEGEKERAQQTALANLGIQNQQTLQKSQQDFTKQGYDEAIKRAQTMGAQGENDFLNSVNQEAPMLGQLKEDILNERLPAQQEALKENALGLKAAGVRGGQAASLLGRETGTLNQGLNRDVNQLAYDDYQRRNAAKQSYLGGKASTANAAALSRP